MKIAQHKNIGGRRYDLWESGFTLKSAALSKAKKLRKQKIPARVISYKDKQSQKRYAVYTG